MQNLINYYFSKYKWLSPAVHGSNKQQLKKTQESSLVIKTSQKKKDVKVRDERQYSKARDPIKKSEKTVIKSKHTVHQYTNYIYIKPITSNEVPLTQLKYKNCKVLSSTHKNVYNSEESLDMQCMVSPDELLSSNCYTYAIHNGNKIVLPTASRKHTKIQNPTIHSNLSHKNSEKPYIFGKSVQFNTNLSWLDQNNLRLNVTPKITPQVASLKSNDSFQSNITEISKRKIDKVSDYKSNKCTLSRQTTTTICDFAATNEDSPGKSQDKLIKQTESSTTRCTTIPSISEQASVEDLNISNKNDDVYVVPLIFNAIPLIYETQLNDNKHNAVQETAKHKSYPKLIALKKESASTPAIKSKELLQNEPDPTNEPSQSLEQPKPPSITSKLPSNKEPVSKIPQQICKTIVEKPDKPILNASLNNVPYKTIEINKRELHKFLEKNEIPCSSLINFNDIKIGSEISSSTNEVRVKPFNNGTFCNVILGYIKNRPCAIKCPLSCHLKADPKMMMFRALKEWKMLCKTNCNKFILNLIGGIFVKKNEVWLVSEYIKGGDLYQRLHAPNECSFPVLTASQRFTIILEIGKALAFIHNLNPKIVHRDLKPNNILIDDSGHIKLCDFGDAEEISFGESIHSYTAVTWQYAPPEIIMATDPARPKGVNEKVDIWSYGCIMLEIINQKTPFWHLLENVEPQHHHNVLKKFLHDTIKPVVMQHSRINFIKQKIPETLCLLISSCLNINPAFRPPANNIVKYLEENGKNVINEIQVMIKDSVKAA